MVNHHETPTNHQIPGYDEIDMFRIPRGDEQYPVNTSEYPNFPDTSYDQPELPGDMDELLKQQPISRKVGGRVLRVGNAGLPQPTWHHASGKDIQP